MAKILFMKNIPFNNQYTNVLHYKPMKYVENGTKVNKISLYNFLKHYDSNIGDLSKYIRYNFNMGNILYTTINVDISSDSSLLNCNYVHVIKENNNELPSNLDYAYYFVTKITQYNRNIYTFNLELDVWTTYDELISFKDLLMTERKHCNRWSNDTPNGDYTLSSDYAMLPDLIDDKHSAIFTKSVKDLEPVQEYSGELISFLKNKSNWKYTFVTLTDELKNKLFLYDSTNKTMKSLTQYESKDVLENHTTKLQLKNATIDIDLNYCIFIQPSNLEIRIDKEYLDEKYQTLIADYGIIHAIDEIVETSSIIGIKLNNSIPSEIIESNNFLVNSALSDVVDYKKVDSSGKPLVIYFSASGTTEGPFIPLIMLRKTKASEVTYNINVTNTTISKNNYDKIKLKNKDYEPKLFTSPYMYQGVKLFYGELYENPLYYYNAPNSSIQIKKRSLCLLNENIENYYYYNSETYYALLNGESNNSMSLNNPCDLPYDIDAYKQAMATSRNAMTTGLLTNSSSTLIKSTIGVANNIASGNVVGTIDSIVSGGIDIATNIANYSAKINDLKNTPNTMACNGSSMTYNASIDDLQPKYVTYEMPNTEKEVVFDYYYNYGYMINKMCVFNTGCRLENRSDIDVYTDSILSRKLFNYVKISDKDIINKMNFNAPLPVKEQIATILQSGCKIWTMIKGNSMTDDELLDCFLSEKYENWEWLL